MLFLLLYLLLKEIRGKNMNLHNPTERVANILKTISENPKKFTLSNISKELNIPKSTLSPILKTLIQLEFLIFEPITQTYEIGLNAFQIGQAYLSNINGLDIIKSHMRSIVNECGETCQLGINHNNEVLYLTKIESPQPIPLLSSIGRNLPLYCTGLGRALLMAYSSEEILKIYDTTLPKYTQYTETNVNEIVKIEKLAHKNGYAMEQREITIDASCVAVPIVINNNIVAALGVSLPYFKAEGNHLQLIISLLKEHSRLITEEFCKFNIVNLF